MRTSATFTGEPATASPSDRAAGIVLRCCGTSRGRRRPERAGVEPALGEVDVTVDELSPLRVGLDTLGDDLQAECPGHLDDVADDGAGRRVRADGVDERLVDLEDVEREAPAGREAGVAGPEVVDQDHEAMSSGRLDARVGGRRFDQFVGEPSHSWSDRKPWCRATCSRRSMV